MWVSRRYLKYYKQNETVSCISYNKIYHIFYIIKYKYKSFALLLKSNYFLYGNVLFVCSLIILNTITECNVTVLNIRGKCLMPWKFVLIN